MAATASAPRRRRRRARRGDSTAWKVRKELAVYLPNKTAEGGGLAREFRLHVLDEAWRDPEGWGVSTMGMRGIGLLSDKVYRQYGRSRAELEDDDDAEIDETAANDDADSQQLELPLLYVGVDPVPTVLCYEDNKVKKNRTIVSAGASIRHYMLAVELKKKKRDQGDERIKRDERIIAELLRRAGGNPDAIIGPLCDEAPPPDPPA